MTEPRFDALLELQRTDTAIDQRRHRLAHLPEAAALAALAEQTAAIEQRRRATAAARDEVARRQAVFEGELAATEDRSRTVSARMYSGEVSASRDLQAMAADLESLKARASDLEDRILEVLDERDPLDASLIADDEELAALAGRRAAGEQALAEAEGGLRAELEELQARRAGAAAGIPAELLADYERIRASAGGVGAARLVGGRCDGCHLTIPSMELDRIRHSPPDAVLHCEECGRILVR